MRGALAVAVRARAVAVVASEVVWSHSCSRVSLCAFACNKFCFFHKS